MKEKWKIELLIGMGFLGFFVLWTILIQCVDVQAAGPNGTKIGFATFNVWFQKLTDVHMAIYTITDWLGLVPIAICLYFAGTGFIQLLKRKSFFQVDSDILFLGIYYILIVFGYLIFEMIPINYRPILINEILEASYPSSTTLLVLSVMPTLKFQIDRRTENSTIRNAVSAFTMLFSAFMVVGRLFTGVHWATDIIGSALLSAGLFLMYRLAVQLSDQRERRQQRGE